MEKQSDYTNYEQDKLMSASKKGTGWNGLFYLNFIVTLGFPLCLGVCDLFRNVRILLMLIFGIIYFLCS